MIEQDDTQPIRPIKPNTLPEPPNNAPVYLREKSKRGAPPDAGFAPIHAPDKRKRDDEPRRSGCLIPAWTILLTLILVFACAFALLAAAITLGGDAEPSGRPQIVLITPAVTPTSPMVAFFTTPTPTLMGTSDAAALATFALEGPTLAPVIFTPTPMQIAVGVQVVADVDGGLNVREQPGISGNILFQASYQALFNVIGGPENVNGLTWWRIQDPFDPSRGGWAAGEFLAVVPPQSP